MRVFLKYFFMMVILTQLSQTIFGQSLSAIDFQKKMATLPNAPILDVRTPAEFNQSHINRAVNININDYNFTSQISKFNKSSL